MSNKQTLSLRPNHALEFLKAFHYLMDSGIAKNGKDYKLDFPCKKKFEIGSVSYPVPPGTTVLVFRIDRIYRLCMEHCQNQITAPLDIIKYQLFALEHIYLGRARMTRFLWMEDCDIHTFCASAIALDYEQFRFFLFGGIVRNVISCTINGEKAFSDQVTEYEFKGIL